MLLVSSQAIAADWKLVTVSSTDAVYRIDSTSVRDQNIDYRSVKIAWFKVDYSKDKTVSHRETKALYHFKCETSEMKMVQFIDYAADGRVVNSDGSNYASFRVAAPDTVGYSMLEAACFDKYF
jgi:hypothetical protein